MLVDPSGRVPFPCKALLLLRLLQKGLRSHVGAVLVMLEPTVSWVCAERTTVCAGKAVCSLADQPGVTQDLPVGSCNGLWEPRASFL